MFLKSCNWESYRGFMQPRSFKLSHTCVLISLSCQFLKELWLFFLLISQLWLSVSISKHSNHNKSKRIQQAVRQWWIQPSWSFPCSRICPVRENILGWTGEWTCGVGSMFRSHNKSQWWQKSQLYNIKVITVRFICIFSQNIQLQEQASTERANL